MAQLLMGKSLAPCVAVTIIKVFQFVTKGREKTVFRISPQKKVYVPLLVVCAWLVAKTAEEEEPVCDRPRAWAGSSVRGCSTSGEMISLVNAEK